MQRKAMLVSHIDELMNSKTLSSVQVAALLGMDVALLECWLKGQFREADEASLLEALQQLEIKLTKWATSILRARK